MNGNENKALSFKNQVFYVGIDVHKKSWTVCIRTKETELEVFSMDPVPEQLSIHLHKKYPDGIYRAVYEAGFSGFWAQRKLSKSGVNCIVVSPGDVPTSNKEKKAKTDQRDARKLSKELVAERLEPIHVLSCEEEELQMLSRQRQVFVKEASRSKNRIRGLINFTGMELSLDNWSGKTLSDLYQKADDVAGGVELKLHIEALKHSKSLIVRSTMNLKQALEKQNKMREVQILKTVPGIGNVAAYTLISEIGDIHRFKGFDQLASWVGLVPTMSNSGEKEPTGEMSRRGNRKLNYILIEAAWIAVRKDPAMLMAFQQLCKKMKKSMAIVRIAKKLLSRVHSVWKNMNPYVVNTVSVKLQPQTTVSRKSTSHDLQVIPELLKKIYQTQDAGLAGKELQKRKADCLDILYRSLKTTPPRPRQKITRATTQAFVDQKEPIIVSKDAFSKSIKGQLQAEQMVQISRL